MTIYMPRGRKKAAGDPNPPNPIQRKKAAGPKQYYISGADPSYYDDPVKCAICKEQYESGSALQQHQRDAHQGEFKCIDCNEDCDSQAALRAHCRRWYCEISKEYMHEKDTYYQGR